MPTAGKKTPPSTGFEWSSGWKSVRRYSYLHLHLMRRSKTFKTLQTHRRASCWFWFPPPIIFIQVFFVPSTWTGFPFCFNYKDIKPPPTSQPQPSAFLVLLFFFRNAHSCRGPYGALCRLCCSGLFEFRTVAPCIVCQRNIQNFSREIILTLEPGWNVFFLAWG